MFSSGEDEIPDSQLSYSTQSLDFRSLDQVQNRAFGYGDESVNGVREDLEAAFHVGVDSRSDFRLLYIAKRHQDFYR